MVAFDVVLAPAASSPFFAAKSSAKELRRVLSTGGRCVVVTNGRGHMHALRALGEAAVRAATPNWEMRNPSTHAFSLENG